MKDSTPCTQCVRKLELCPCQQSFCFCLLHCRLRKVVTDVEQGMNFKCSAASIVKTIFGTRFPELMILTVLAELS